MTDYLPDSTSGTSIYQTCGNDSLQNGFHVLGFTKLGSIDRVPGLGSMSWTMHSCCAASKSRCAQPPGSSFSRTLETSSWLQRSRKSRYNGIWRRHLSTCSRPSRSSSNSALLKNATRRRKDPYALSRRQLVVLRVTRYIASST